MDSLTEVDRAMDLLEQVPTKGRACLTAGLLRVVWLRLEADCEMQSEDVREDLNWLESLLIGDLDSPMEDFVDTAGRAVAEWRELRHAVAELFEAPAA